MTFPTLPSAFGTGATGAVVGTDTYGYVTLTSGTGSSNGSPFALNFTATEEISKNVSVRLFPLDSTTEGLGISIGVSDGPNGEIAVTVNSGIADSTTYQWVYRVD